MGFDSLHYYLFLYVVVFVCWYWRPGVGLLLGASLAFYASFDPRHLPLLLALALLAWRGGLALAGGGKRLLAALLALCFAPLLFWKTGAGTVPLGLSFFTFHCASYLIDSYRGTLAPERRAARIFLGVSFFPQLIAGPITRAGEQLPQLETLRRPDGATARRALWRIYLGLFKKFAIANTLGAFMLEVFRRPGDYHPVAVAAAVLAGRYYIFADFSGYTDIAIGSARLLGIELPENFRRPFAATSIADYWRRWHITLSLWIRDYLLYPLVASPFSRLGTYPLVIFTFLALGAWHGLTVNFLLYGLWHGALLSLYDLTRKARTQLWRAAGALPPALSAWGTFLFLVCPPTVLFFTATPSEALRVLAAIGGAGAEAIPVARLLPAVASLCLLEAFQWHSHRHAPFAFYERLPPPARWLFCIGATAWLWRFGDFTSGLGFLYFRF